jgi:hypothetical protein
VRADSGSRSGPGTPRSRSELACAIFKEQQKPLRMRLRVYACSRAHINNAPTVWGGQLNGFLSLLTFVHSTVRI